MNFFKKNIIFFLFVIKRFHGENINNYLLYLTLVFVLKSCHSKKSFSIVPNERFLGLAFRKSEVMFFVSPSKKRDAFISVRDE